MNYETAILVLAKSGKTEKHVISDILVRRQNTCAFCDRITMYLCDYHIAWSNWGPCDGNEDDRRLTSDSAPITCDAPLCGECRTKAGTSFDFNGPGSVDTIDICPQHAHMYKSHCRPIELSEGAVESIRLKVWKFKYMQEQAK